MTVELTNVRSANPGVHARTGTGVAAEPVNGGARKTPDLMAGDAGSAPGVVGVPGAFDAPNMTFLSCGSRIKNCVSSGLETKAKFGRWQAQTCAYSCQGDQHPTAAQMGSFCQPLPPSTRTDGESGI